MLKIQAQINSKDELKVFKYQNYKLPPPPPTGLNSSAGKLLGTFRKDH